MKNWKIYPRAFLFIMLVAGLCAGAVVPRLDRVEAKPLAIAATNVVISEFSTLGSDEFIELYNPTSNSINIGDWQIWGSNGSSPPSKGNRKTIPTGTNIPAGGYYLVANSSGSFASSADLTYGTGITDDGGIALFTPSDLVNPVDQVGMSINSAYKEGTILTPLNSTTGKSYERKSYGCLDDGNNSTDFSLKNPSNPQNKSSLRQLCGVSTDLSLTQSVNNASPAIGTNVEFTIVVSNLLGSTDATGVKVKDALPAGLTYVSDDSGGAYSGGIWTIGALTSNSSATIKITAKVEPSGAKTNTAEIAASDQFDPDSTPNNGSEDDYASITITPVSADLSLVQSVNNSTPAVGSNVMFTLTVSNANTATNVQATNVKVKDALPAGLTYVSSSPVGVYDNTTGIWSVGTLANGDAATLSITATVDGSVPDPINAAEVWSVTQYDPDSTAGNNSTTEDDDDFAQIKLAGKMNITNIANNLTPSVGSNVVFTITVTNSHATTGATNVKVAALLPNGLTYVSHSSPAGTTYTSGTGIWSIGSLSAGGSKSLLITAKVISGIPALSYSYLTVVSSDQFADNSDTETINPAAGTDADLSLTQTWNRPNLNDITLSAVTPAIVDLKITVHNDELAAGKSATNIQVKDLLPTGLDYVAYNATSGSYSYSNGIWSISTLTAGASETLTIRVKASATGKTNFAEIWRSDQFDKDSTPGNGKQGEDDETEKEVLVADLSLTQTVNIASGIAVFTIKVTNTGPDNATNVKITNSTLATSYTYVSHSSTTGTYTFGTGDWDIPTLLKGANATLIVTTNAPSGTLPENWVQVSDMAEVDPDSLPGNCTSPYVAVCIEDDDAGGPSADLSLTQVILSPAPYANSNINDNVKFRITVTNAGVSDAKGVQVKDQLPSGLTYVTNTPSAGTYNASTYIWDVGNLAAGASQTLDITATVASYGIKTNWAEVWNSDHSDPDSIPKDGSTTDDDDASAIVTSYRSVVINEIAWAGTTFSPGDEWLELFNPSSADITLTGWKIRRNGCNTPIVDDYIFLSGTIAKGGYFLLERGDYATDNTTTDVAANQIYYPNSVTNLPTPLSDTGEVLYLCDNYGNYIDTANGDGGAWPQGGASPNYPTMERTSYSDAETDANWLTNNGFVKNGLDAKKITIYGTPGKKNSTGVQPTPTRTPTPAPTSTPVPPLARLVINEFLPRPGYDWNQDGRVDVFDEFVEIKNISLADVKLSGWRLDDVENAGSAPFSLPDITLKPGERALFFALQTNILLSDGGDSVRLINPSGKTFDKYTYAIAKFEDKSVCRLPDGNGSWYEDCTPTPKQINTRAGVVPSMPDKDYESPMCSLPDTLPADFLFAECHGYGANIWRRMFWDANGWGDVLIIRDAGSKREAFLK